MTESMQTTDSHAHNSVTSPLLLEVGCEEIPARFLAQTQKDLGERVKVMLEESRLSVQEPGSPGAPIASPQIRFQTYSTPRRLIVYVPEILARQPDKTEEVMGPPVKVALDAIGKYTRAGESFAQKNSIAVEDLIRVTTPKGEYLAVKKTTEGRPSLDVLSEVLPGAITGMSFPKSMYWEKSGARFVRPIRWIVALLGEGSSAQVIPLEVAGVKSGSHTYGHRLAKSEAIAVTGFKDFGEKLRSANVEFDPESRRQTIKNELNVLLEEDLSAEVIEDDEALFEAVPDADLEDWIVNSTEWASGILGEFNDRFLHLPREILITVMRDHQKYFAVQDSHGKLHPYFIALLGRDRDTTGTIRAGHERVLTARFSDAEFFWNADQKTRLRDRMAMLERVTYQAKLGSYGDKVRRMEVIAKEICRSLEELGKLTPTETAEVLGAVLLCKCDLTTQMVQEFTELQGIVGGLYARAQGEPQAVSDAIFDHYLPQGPEDKCPRSLVGAVVSLADKIDSVVAGFATGNAPTGSSDPFALRRYGNGVIKIIVANSFRIELGRLIQNACDHLLRRSDVKIFEAIMEFMHERLRSYLEEVEGLQYDTVRAVFAARLALLDLVVPVSVVECARDLEKIRTSPDFLNLAQSAKRIRNILSKSVGVSDWGERRLDPGRLEPGAERNLFEAYSTVKGKVDIQKSEAKYYEALESIASLSPAVDLFFDEVLVMTDDLEVRRNRAQLLWELERLYSDIADLSKIELSVAA